MVTKVGEELLKLHDRPTAVILIYELMAIGLYRRLMEAGIVPGREIAVVSFREAPRAKFLQPALTCFRSCGSVSELPSRTSQTGARA